MRNGIKTVRGEGGVTLEFWIGGVLVSSETATKEEWEKSMPKELQGKLLPKN